jgi:hypothetical protein
MTAKQTQDPVGKPSDGGDPTVIELDLVAADAFELWNRTGAGAGEEQSLHDLHPGRLRFTVNGTDLSPTGWCRFLASPRR